MCPLMWLGYVTPPWSARITVVPNINVLKLASSVRNTFSRLRYYSRVSEQISPRFTPFQAAGSVMARWSVIAAAVILAVQAAAQTQNTFPCPCMNNGE